MNVKNMPKYEEAKAAEKTAKEAALEAENAAAAASFKDKAFEQHRGG